MSSDSPSRVSGRILGIDLGGKRIGLAISDPTQLIASPLMIIRRTSRANDLEQLQAIVGQHDVMLCVVGLPTYLNGADSPQTIWVRGYADFLEINLGIRVVLHDETLSTAQARELLLNQGARRKRRSAPVDAIAAAIILQSYLDEHRATSVHEDVI